MSDGAPQWILEEQRRREAIARESFLWAQRSLKGQMRKTEAEYIRDYIAAHFQPLTWTTYGDPTA